jgi:hypothetical protein
MMAQDTGMTSRTTNPNNDPRLQSTKSLARNEGISYKRDNSEKSGRKSDGRKRRY